MWPKKVYDENKIEKLLLEPYNYISKVGTYDFTATKLTKAFNYWMKIPQEKLKQIEEIADVVKNSIAMFDDVQDGAKYRRFVPATHHVFGTGLSINTSIHLLFLGLEKILDLGHAQGSEIYCKLMLGFLRGQGTDIYWRDNFLCPSEDEFKQMSANKTGSFLYLIVQLMQLFSDNKTDYHDLVMMFSVYYQIRDDYANLNKQEALEEGSRVPELQELDNISFCEDFTDGKLSWVVAHGLKGPHRLIIIGLLKMRSHDKNTKKYLLSLLEESGSLQFARDTMTKMEQDITTEISRLGGNPVFEDLMRDLHNWHDEYDKEVNNKLCNGKNYDNKNNHCNIKH